ncbi:unnamed protein product [Plutella xylostella]|uniref:(diamondback moth) hypothetical protein n=1 Tax=Plutella xylostella TaxID=51655 RepID=A0A8S4G1E6_PLUXY|nr:unnamed protein product [Plutella xylostella]
MVKQTALLNVNYTQHKQLSFRQFSCFLLCKVFSTCFPLCLKYIRVGIYCRSRILCKNCRKGLVRRYVLGSWSWRSVGSTRRNVASTLRSVGWLWRRNNSPWRSDD